MDHVVTAVMLSEKVIGANRQESSKSSFDTTSLENEWVQFAVKEAVKVALESPLRRPILDAVEEDGGVTNVDRASSGSRLTTFVRGTMVFVVALSVLYLTLRKRLAGGD